ncbi:MAG TPA: PDZ domain-containing protein [Armatimonadetes bacterium]|nr:PDZ domain-containing protein [Armatimonadota bacterium]
MRGRDFIRWAGYVSVSLLLVLCGTWGFGVGFWWAQSLHPPLRLVAPPRSEVSAAVEEAFRLLQEHYCDLPSSADLRDGALHGLIAALDDPQAVYLTPEEYQALRRSWGDFEGIGALLCQDRDTDRPIVLEVFADHPAERAGLKPGDRILRVDGQDTAGVPLDVTVEWIRGPAGTPVRLEVAHVATPTVHRTLRIVRDYIRLPVVEARRLTDGIGYLRLLALRPYAPSQVAEALTSLQPATLRGLIVDLRYTSERLETTPLARLWVQGRVEPLNLQFNFAWPPEVPAASPDRPERTLPRELVTSAVLTAARAIAEQLTEVEPVAVLINGQTAGAAEWLAAALRQRGAKLVGEQTAGQNRMATIFPLSHGGALILPTDEWLTPKGQSIAGQGLTPDVAVSSPLSHLAHSLEEVTGGVLTFERTGPDHPSLDAPLKAAQRLLTEGQ